MKAMISSLSLALSLAVAGFVVYTAIAVVSLVV